MTDRDRLARMREAAVAGRAAVRQLTDALRAAERELEVERQQLRDAERRGRLAAEIEDGETAEVAQRFAARHAERVQVLERKVDAQRAELALVERDVEDMVAQLKQLELGVDPGAARPAAEPGDEDPLLRFKLDQAAREAAADEALKALKKRMGK